MPLKVKNLTLEIVLKFLQEQEIELKSTHDKLCFPIINRIYKKMTIGIKFPSIKVDGDLIIDGHHRYLASLLADHTLDFTPSLKTSATIIYSWNKVILDVND